MSSRRDFLTNTLAALAGSSFFVNHAQGQGGTAGRTEMTIRQAIDRIIADIPDAPFKTTVDTVKSGDPEQPAHPRDRVPGLLRLDHRAAQRYGCGRAKKAAAFPELVLHP